MKTLPTLCFAVISSSLLSCAPDIEATEVVLVVDSDLSAPAEVDSVDVSVFNSTGQEMNAFATLVVGDQRFPRTLGIYNVDTRLESYRVVARARLGGEIIVQRTASFDFVRDQTLRLTLFLPAACADISCDDGMTCTEGGVCRSTDVELEPWTGSASGIRLSIDAGMD